MPVSPLCQPFSRPWKRISSPFTTRLRFARKEVIARTPISICADRDRIGEVLANLISNAVKYNDKPEPWVEIGTAEPENPHEVTLYVRDNGIGFKPEYAEQIFGVFKRLHGTANPGTGIGLAICKRIVELHGGRIWATGEEGRGATFLFSLHGASKSAAV